MSAAAPFVAYSGPCWRAVRVGREADALTGGMTPGRYNRPDNRALYFSGSPAGVAAAMRRYGDAPRMLVEVSVEAKQLVDLRSARTRAALGIALADTKADWLAALARNEEPPSWRAADAVRASGATGLMEWSRRAPAESHLVLFSWNEPGGAVVTMGKPPKEWMQ